MVTNLISVIAMCIIATVLCKLFEKYGREYSLFIAIAVSSIVIIGSSVYIAPILETLNTLFARTGMKSEYLTILFKALGISYLAQFAYDVCKDSGESALASQIELAGKIALLAIALPLFKNITDIVVNLIYS